MSSWYLMHRGWMDHPVFDKETYTQREAWEWIISSAVYNDEGKIISINNSPYRVPEGCLCYSLRFLATAWGWDKARVSRFLKKLEKWDMIETATETGQTLIRVCNYLQYQRKETATETAKIINPRQGRDRGETNKKEGIKKDKEIKNNILKPDDVSDGTWQDFLSNRKAKKAPVTQTVINKIRTEANRANWKLDDALQECCSRGWQSFKADWVKKKEEDTTNAIYDIMEHTRKVLSDGN